MARRACNGGIEIVEAATPADTAGFGIVSILAEAAPTVTVGEASGSLSACPDADLIDPSTGEPLTGSETYPMIVSYIGYARYVQTSSGFVILDEAGRTTPIE